MKRFPRPLLRMPRSLLRGMSLIELLVAVIVGVVVSLAIYTVLVSAEGRKRTTTSVNDINQGGSYVQYILDRWLRSAGSGFASGVTMNGSSTVYPYGCKLYAANSSAGQLLPAANQLPAPFASISQTFRLTPVLIIPNGTTPGVSGQPSDVLVIMAGSAGASEMATAFSGFPTANTAELLNTVDFSANDLVLLSEIQPQASSSSTASANYVLPCMVQQVQSNGSGSTTLSLGGSYAAATIASRNMIDMSDQGGAFNLGNISAGRAPNFLVIGVGANNTLFSYDLLQTTASPKQAIADGVFEIHARYGLASGGAGTAVNTWIAPDTTTSSYSYSSLSGGTTAATNTLRQIRAVRVGIIMRTSLPERTASSAGGSAYVAPASLTLFSDLEAAGNSTCSDSAQNGSVLTSTGALRYTRCLGTSERNYRYRVLDFTVPLRNL
ncbi:hypothetical protein GCM10028811_13730 [Uliginosibacterium sediminicola]